MVADRWKHKGWELDTEFGLQLNRAHYLNQKNGRGTTQDPLGFDAGDANLMTKHNENMSWSGVWYKRKLYWLPVPLIGLTFVAILILYGSKEKITRRNYERIREGMTDAEVRSILGPPGVAAGASNYITIFSGPVRGRVTGEQKEWVGRKVIINVYFDERGNVAGTALGGVNVNSKSIMQRLRSYFGL